MASVHSKSKAPIRRSGSPARSSDPVSSQAGGAGAAGVQMAEQTPQPVLGAFYQAGPTLSLTGSSSSGSNGANGHGPPGAPAGNGSNGAGGVQFKLAISRPGDPYEREADAAADRVTSGGAMPAITPLGPGALSRLATLQRKGAEEEEEQPIEEEGVQICASCEEERQGAEEPPRVQRQANEEEEEEDLAGREEAVQPSAIQRQAGDEEAREPEVEQPCENCDEDRSGVVQRPGEKEEEPADHKDTVQRQEREKGEPAAVQAAPADEPGVSAADNASIGNALNHPGAGTSLAPSVRSRLERGLDADLSQVRVHHDAAAQNTAQTLNARAFTHGRDIWLGAGESPHDLRLLAHESAHVVQQGVAGSTTQAIQRAPADYRHPEDGGGVRSRLESRFREEIGDRGEQNARTATGPSANARQEARQVDRREVAAKKGELRGSTRPDVDRPAEEGPEIDHSAAVVDQEAESPPETLVEGEQSQQPENEEGAGPEAMDAAEQAAGMADQAYAAADAQLQPPEPAAVEPVEPVSEPVDAAGEPLTPDSEADLAMADLAERVQYLRDQGSLVRARAAEGHANAEIVRGNLAKVSGEVSKAEEGVSKSQAHSQYRQELIGQAAAALDTSREKQATVAAGAPEFQSKADEGKEDTGPMRSEASATASENAANSPDDPDAAEDSREQGEQINQVGEGSVTMDDAVSRTRGRADSLAQDAADAAQKNEQTQGKITESQGQLDTVTQRLDGMEAETSQARTQVTDLQTAPDQIHNQANALDEQGATMIASSEELEERLHTAQKTYLDAASTVPPIEPAADEEDEPEGAAETVGGPPTGGLAGGLEPPASIPSEGGSEAFSGGEAAVQRQRDERAVGVDQADAAAPPDLSASTSTDVPAVSAAEPASTTEAGGSPVAAAGAAGPSAAPGSITGELSAEMTQEAAAEAPIEEGVAGEGAEGEGVQGEEAEGEAGEEGAPIAEAGPGSAGTSDAAGVLAAPSPFESSRRREEDALTSLPPDVLRYGLGIDPRSVLNRQEAQEARDEQRHAEIEYIQDQLGNRQLTEVGYGERLGIVMGVFGQQIQGLISNIRWPGWGPIAKALLDPRSYLMGVVSGLNMILTGASNVFSLEQWQRDPVGNLLKSAASIATGLTVILGTITALAGVIAAVMGALILITFGGAAPFALPIISFCTTVITTVGGWTLAVGKIALVLQALSLIKNLIDVGTARTADDLQRESEEIASDLGGAATVVLSIAGARGAQAGLQSTRNSVAGVLRAARRAGGGRALARATARAAPGAARRLGARLSRRGRVALGRLAGGGRRGAAAALGLAGGAGRLGLRFGLPIAFGALAAQGDLPMEGGPGTAGSTEEETPEDEGPSDISVEGAWVDVTPPEEASPGANVVSRYPIQRIKNWERYENTVAARLRTGRISGIPQMDHVISGVYGASGHGVDFFGLRVRGNRIYVYHIEVKSGRNPRLGRVFGGTRTQTGADWTDNAIERFLRDPVASRRLQRVLRMHGRPTDEASMRRLLRQGLRSSGRSFVVVRGWLLRRIRRQLGGIKRHRGTRAPRLRRFRFRF